MLLFLPGVSSVSDQEDDNLAKQVVEIVLPAVASAVVPSIAAAVLNAGDMEAISTVDGDTPSPPRKYKPKPPKRRKKLCKRKKTRYSFTEAKAALALPASANQREIEAAILQRADVASHLGGSSRSPLKAAVKKQNQMLLEQDKQMKEGMRKKDLELERLRNYFVKSREKILDNRKELNTQRKQLKKLEEENEEAEGLKRKREIDRKSLKENGQTIKNLKQDATEVDTLRKERHKYLTQISNLKNSNAELAQQLKTEKEASRITISKRMDDSEYFMEEANALKRESRKDAKKLEEEKREKQQLHREKRWSARQMESSKLILILSVFILFPCQI